LPSLNWMGTLLAARVSLGALLVAGVMGACSKTNNVSQAETTNNSYATIVGKQGGVVGKTASVAAVIPENAVDGDQEITINTAADDEYPALPASAVGTVYSFEPHGIEFNAEVDVYLPRPGAGDYTIWHAAPGGAWQNLGRTGPQKPTSIHTKTLSFSYFVVVQDDGSAAPAVGAGGSTGNVASGGGGSSGAGAANASAGVAGVSGVTTPPEVPLTLENGWVIEDQLKLHGPMFAFADDTSKMGMTSDFGGPDACIGGVAGQVDLACTPTPPATDCYASVWGAAIALNLNQAADVGGQAQPAEPFDASVLQGFSFTLSGTVPDGLRFRVNDESDTEYCSTKPLVEGLNRVMFDELETNCWAPPGTRVDSSLKNLKSIGWHVVTNPDSPTPFDFCVMDLLALTAKM
jgi:hypothetical protein